jgi:hypothetical protein
MACLWCWTSATIESVFIFFTSDEFVRRADNRQVVTSRRDDEIDLRKNLRVRNVNAVPCDQKADVVPSSHSYLCGICLRLSWNQAC